MTKKLGTQRYSEQIVSDWLENPIRITLFRYTLKHTEHLPERIGGVCETYTQTNWDSVQLIPKKGVEIVKIEEKVVEVSDKCLRRTRG
jgi:hypothetical protein